MKSRGRIHIRTLGCPKNEADGLAMVRYLERAGWTVVDDPDQADAEIVNTCGFIEPTKLESLDAIWESVGRKTDATSGKRHVIATGCLAQRYCSDLATEIPELDAVIGFNRPDLVNDALELSINGNGNGSKAAPVCWVEKPDTIYRDAKAGWEFDESHPAPLSAYIKIGDGCDNACRFCAIPLIRGKLRSRPAKSICEEIRILTENGTREVILVSQDTTSWGLDRPDQGDLASLLREIEAIPGDFWVRPMYLHPAFLTDRHIAAIGDCEKVIPYVDMPLQHVTDRMLEIMNRHTTKAEIQSKINALRTARPGMVVRTTFLLGHPGETDADFEELSEFAAENAFERMGVFGYSEEDSTPAARMDDKVSEEIARERASLLMGAFDNWSADQSNDKIGLSVPCLLESRDSDGVWSGRTVHDAPEIDGRIIVSGDGIDSPGLYTILVSSAEGVDLTGRCATPTSPATPSLAGGAAR